ncbi:hypothetical protein MCOR02_005159 [Pyricularia oryzae]|nr:hypothetical protein OOU_Y34scaffold00767g23 [Pyricularia oryzae Y34]KAH9436252.1 hypothetical protein MCOR02_005159 [Pyricularia oryzae]KAI6505540.1 hypothetical protein MCOR13_004039 [Pyricularia oryzae]KAI6637635.1 hypothetical protein MCOR14_004727 [Pyricularia oryzae]KAI7920646.1 hypothetical protein M0657_006495 [Pyricularia oryzae]
MPCSSIFFSGAVAGSLFAQAALAYTVVQIPSPFMTKNIDPIVFPGAFDKSHLHSFFGADAVTATTSTTAQLQDSCTNAENPNDLSIYWVPTLLYTKDGGKTHEPVPVSRFSAYYNLGETEAQTAIPQDLKMVAGNATAKSAAEMPADAKIAWFCESEANPPPADKNGFPSKTCTTHLQHVIFFPNCVDSATLKTAYKSKSAGTANGCPEGMLSMPQLRFSIRYDLRRVLPGGWDGEAPVRQACGENVFCSHGDFINGWSKEAAENMIGTTKEKYHFAAVEGDRKKKDCKQRDADPTHGTSDFAESVKLMSKRSVETVGWTSRSRMMRI